MRKSRIVIILITLVVIGALTIIPYFPLFFGKLGTVIENYELESRYADLKFNNPVDFQSVEINTTGEISYRIFVVEQSGLIYEIINANSLLPEKELFLNIQSLVSSGGEKGLLGLALHPNFDQNGFLFVDYTASSPLRTIIARFTVIDPMFGKPNINSQKIVIEVNQPYDNHNAGQIMFGLDGYLYITLGDGGLANDPDENGQNRRTLLGSILRVDIDVPDNQQYSIPSDNPYFENVNGYKEEILAYGFRNPWRMSQDKQTGLIYVGDVGQNKLEEIDVIIPDSSNKNYGWDKKEGDDCFLSFSCDGNFIDPIAQYPRSEGISVTGGYVYYGTDLVGLDGHYLFGDYWSGMIWSLEYDGNKVIHSGFVGQYEIKISSFGLEPNGNIVVVSYDDGIIYEFVYVGP